MKAPSYKQYHREWKAQIIKRKMQDRVKISLHKMYFHPFGSMSSYYMTINYSLKDLPIVYLLKCFTVIPIIGLISVVIKHVNEFK